MPLCCFWISQHRLASAFAAQAALFDLPGPSAFCGKARDAASVRPMRKDIHERVRRHVVFPKTRRFASVASSARPRGASRTSDTDSAYNYFSASLRLSHGLRQILLDTILMASCPPFVSCSSSCINTTSFLRIAPLNGAAQCGCNPRSSRHSNAANLTRQFACKASLPIDMPRSEASHEKAAASRNLRVQTQVRRPPQDADRATAFVHQARRPITVSSSCA